MRVYACGEVYATMGIADYFSERVHALDQSLHRIKDFHVFDFNHIPEQPLMREEIKPIIDACLRYLKTGIPNHLFIFGSRGCGKTLMLKYIQRLLRGQATVCYVNCRQHNTSFKILAHLLCVKPRGCSLDELWLRFCDAHAGRLILILDEVDLLSEKDRHKDILYLLARSTSAYMSVLLSNHPKFLGRLDESIRSSLQPEMIHFRNYDADQVRAILVDRARGGLHEWSESIVAQIAALTVSATNADVRVAIKALYYLALEQSEDVRAVFERARRDLIVDVLTDLNDQNLYILMAIAESTEPFVKTVYERYRQITLQHHETPFSYVYFYTSLSYLQSIGLVLLLSTKVGRTYTNQIQLLFAGELLDAILQTRLG
ncbi:MAG: orc1/cdc6 family replication initiation protein [Phycisphaerae bacterium]|nr:orc1/cdc6 family replication initiation protein [Phycisphaerae bacterium]